MAQQEVDNARSEFQAAQAVMDAAKKDLDDTEIRAGIEGRVGRTLLEVGARVTVGWRLEDCRALDAP